MAQPTAVSFGSAATPISSGTSDLETVTVSNQGGSMLTLSSVATTGPYVVLDPLPANAEVPPGSSVTLQLLFLPTGTSPAPGSLVLDAKGMSPTSVALTGYDSGTGYAIPRPGTSGWSYAGSASASGSILTLTPNEQNQAGSAFWQVPVTSGTFTANFTASADGGTGGDGEALVLADTSALGASPQSPLGGGGDGVGFGGTAGLAVVIGEYQDPGTTSAEWIGIANGLDPSTGGLNFVGTPVNLDVNTQNAANDVTVTLQNSTIFAWVDGTEVLDQPVNAPPSFLLGFSGGTGFYTDAHLISNASIVVGGNAP
jgi:hypothetical protein